MAAPILFITCFRSIQFRLSLHWCRTHPCTVESSSLARKLILTLETTTIRSVKYYSLPFPRLGTVVSDTMCVWAIAASTPHPYSAQVHRSRARIPLRKVVWNGNQRERGMLVFILIKSTGVWGQPCLNPCCRLFIYLVFILFFFFSNPFIQWNCKSLGKPSRGWLTPFVHLSGSILPWNFLIAMCKTSPETYY